MISFEIPIDYSHAQYDPNYESRGQLVEARKIHEPLISSCAQVIGNVANRAAFTAPIDFPALYGWDPKDTPSHFNGEISFEMDVAAEVARYVIPEELGQFKEVIEIVAKHEHGSYPHANYSHNKAQLAVRQNVLVPGQAQSGGENRQVHRDGYASLWSHVYVATNAYPTEFFEFGLPGIAGPEHHIDPSTLGAPFIPEVYDVAFANSTTLHRSPIVQDRTERTFLRAIYAHKV